jgi:hypothetical protein
MFQQMDKPLNFKFERYISGYIFFNLIILMNEKIINNANHWLII